MFILAIESSCDETSIAFLQQTNNRHDNFVEFINSFNIRASIISSQISTHSQYGGVIPEVGARLHAENIHKIFMSVMNEIGSGLDILGELDCICVTSEPGLISALRVGMEFAKTLQFFIEKQFGKRIKITKVNHLRGHIASCFYQQNDNSKLDSHIFPHLHLLVSGGNSQLVLLNSWQEWHIVGSTLDDAAGETLDKIGRMLGIAYPGGATIAKIAGLRESNILNLPSSMKNSELNYSFSGLKTAVRYHIQKQDIKGLTFEKQLSEDEINQLKSDSESISKKLEYISQVCISSQHVVVDQLVRKVKLAIQQFQPKSLGLSGGVSANELLRQKVIQAADIHNIKRVFIPQLSLTGDNAVMIGLAGVADMYYLAN
jgi:N6-L-threonylcarbamoyladenine synthase